MTRSDGKSAEAVVPGTRTTDSLKGVVPGWTYAPVVPLQVSPFFRWPLRPADMIKWLWQSWFLVTERSLLVVCAYISTFVLQPPMNEDLGAAWLKMHVRNLFLMLLV